MNRPAHEHPIDIKVHSGRVDVRFHGALVASSENALVLQEAGYPPVFYLPEADTRPGHFVRSQHHTRCPYKGEASYYNLVHDGQVAENAAWTYEDPKPEVALIRGHVAFYPEQVSIRAED
ncbi:DUF427 domain-containing protein [Pseudomonas citronellolis]|uniref:DUF427 domain-containing protein n=1 Tax=Pseudomonas citronellolis TaxID=53408 RepID=UPI0023E45F29|nr:DUF427 domain-containing protein [Pseudomonas citronellolis]MDF3935919.1 DUF427 domain-containing protein [Pseudomonas citronellolis]